MEQNRNQGTSTDSQKNPAGQKEQGGRAQSSDRQAPGADKADDRSRSRDGQSRSGEHQPEDETVNRAQGGNQGQGGRGQNDRK